MTLSPSTSRVLEAVVDLAHKLGHSPSRDEVAERAGVTRGTAQYHLLKLAAAGLVQVPTDGRRRGLVVLSQDDRRTA